MNENNFITVPYTRELQLKLSQTFSCGNVNIDMFIKSPESLDTLFGKTYILYSENELIGYYNISTGHIEHTSDNISERQGGSLYLNYFAINDKFQKIKYNENWYISDWLLMDCISRAIYIQENIVGFSFIALSSTEEGLHLYKRNGFEELDDDMRFVKNRGEEPCKAMFLAMDFEE